MPHPLATPLGHMTSLQLELLRQDQLRLEEEVTEKAKVSACWQLLEKS